MATAQPRAGCAHRARRAADGPHGEQLPGRLPALPHHRAGPRHLGGLCVDRPGAHLPPGKPSPLRLRVPALRGTWSWLALLASGTSSHELGADIRGGSRPGHRGRGGGLAQNVACGSQGWEVCGRDRAGLGGQGVGGAAPSDSGKQRSPRPQAVTTPGRRGSPPEGGRPCPAARKRGCGQQVLGLSAGAEQWRTDIRGGTGATARWEAREPAVWAEGTQDAEERSLAFSLGGVGAREGGGGGVGGGHC